jgi:hypothetical protein
MKRRQTRLRPVTAGAQINCYFSFLFLFAANLISCNTHVRVKYQTINDGKNRCFIKRIYDKDLTLLTEEELNSDSIRSGFYKEYDMGRVKCLGYYTENLKDSTWLYFDFAGDTIKKENWFNGKRFGEQFEYYSKIQSRPKNQLYKYIFTNVNGSRLFDMSFKPDSKIEKVSGTPIYVAYNSDKIKVDSDFVLMLFFGNPPTYSYGLTVNEWNVNLKRELSKTRIADTSKAMQNLYFARKYMIQTKYSKAGIYRWAIEFSIKDSLDQILVHDTISLDVKAF